MKKSGKRTLVIGIMLIIAFAVWTILIQMVDVQQHLTVGFTNLQERICLSISLLIGWVLYRWLSA